VARADGPIEDVPQVVESPVGMLGVDVRYIRQPEASLVDEDEWIDLFVRRPAGGQGLQNGLPHDPDPCCILHKNGASFRRLNVVLHASFSFRASVSPFDWPLASPAVTRRVECRRR
jgi:hypothetical protein